MINIEHEKLPVLLSIRGEQYFDDIDPDATELMTEGTMVLTEDGMVLSYEETELTGMEGTTTTFEVKGPQVILTRTGTVNSQMVFEEGRQHTSLYETPLLWNYAAAGNVAHSLFSAGDKNRRIEEAVARMRVARSKVAEAEQSLYNNLVTAVLNAERAKKSLDVARVAEQAARENYEIVENRYEVQMASALERTDAQVQLTSARANVVTASFDYLDTQITIAYLLGE